MEGLLTNRNSNGSASSKGPLVNAMEGLLTPQDRNGTAAIIAAAGGGDVNAANNTAIQQILSAFAAGYNNAKLSPRSAPSADVVYPAPAVPAAGTTASSPSPSPSLSGVLEAYLATLGADLKNASSSSRPLVNAISDAFSSGYGSATNSTKTLAATLGDFVQSFLGNKTAAIS